MFDAVITGAVGDLSDSLLVIVPVVLAAAAGLLGVRVGWKYVRGFIK